MKIFDTHTHLNLKQFAGRLEEELELARELGVAWHNVVGFDRESIEAALVLAEADDSIYLTLGWHPTEAGSYDDQVEDYLREILAHPKVVALGEIGLDYHWMTASKEVQEKVFRRQIRLAKELDLPVVIHTRDALDDTYAILADEGLPARGGIMHSYSGSLEMAEKFMKLGMWISFSGVVTFKKALDIQEAAANLPLDRILLETDAPFLAPVPYRGKENRTAYTRYVAEKVADLRGISLEELVAATSANAWQVFGLDGEHR